MTPAIMHAMPPIMMVVGLVWGNPVINAIRERGTADVDEIIRTVARSLEARFGALSLRVPLRGHVVTAVKA